MSNQQEKIIEISLPHEIYHASLKTINEIVFTQREIDIIACILSGRITKKIASLLVLSPKTIENHIRNIRLKLKVAGTQENIIDFIENSDKFSALKKYYASLMVQIEFELELKKISAMMSVYKENLCCVIVYHKDEKDKVIYINQLKLHLHQLGITTSMLVKETYKDFSNVFNQIQAEKPNRIFFIFSDSMLTDNAHFFEQVQELEYISLAMEHSYYNFFFKILRRIWNDENLDTHVLAFNAQCQKYFEFSPSLQKSETHTNVILQKKEENSVFFSILRKKTGALVLCFLLICVGFLTMVLKKEPTAAIADNNSKYYNAITNFEAKEICKVPEPCEFFAGRIEFIENIKNSLKENKKVVVVGYQGMGKTQVSYQYAKQNAVEYEGGTYIFKADSEQSLINSIRAFAIVMGIVTQSEVYRLNDDQVKKLIIPLLQDNLKSRKTMLLIFDNVDDYDSIKDLVSIHSKQHHLVITSSSKKWDAWNILELKEFDQAKEEAERLILKVLTKETHGNAQKLASKLSYYPLAISQAINYLKNNNIITIDDYIKEYDSLYERRKTFLSYYSFEQNHYVKTTLTAFEISKKKLIEELSEAYYLLKLCSHFSHDIIPVSIFKNTVKDISSALEVLHKYSVLDIININGELYLNMHNVLRDSIKIQIHEKGEEDLIEEKVLVAMDQYFIYDFWDKHNIEKLRLIIPHVEYFLSYLNKKNSALLKTHKLINLLGKSGAYHIHCFRDTDEAIRLLEKAKHLAQFIGPGQNELVNRILEDLATSYYYQGEYNKARHEIQLAHTKKGASALSFIIDGHILYNECRFDEAQVAYEKVLKILNKNKNLQYLALANRSLGLVFYKKSLDASPEKSKMYIELSKEFLEKALETQESFNSENLELAITMHAYGRTAIQLKEFDKAKQALSKALKMAIEYCKKDEDHYEILVMKRTYGYYLCKHEKEYFEEGIQYLKEALEGKFRIYKKKPHQAVIGTIERIVEVYALKPRHKKFIQLIPVINQYLDNWALAEKSDCSKNLNNAFIGEKIRAMKKAINNVKVNINVNTKEGVIL